MPDVLKAVKAAKSAEGDVEKEDEAEKAMPESEAPSEADEKFRWEFPNKFLKALSKNGPESAKTWARQDVLSVPAVLFYLAHRDDETGQSCNEQDSIKAAETVGLIAASGQYCRLSIQEVPVHAKYTIGEYDGKERVCLL